MTASSAVVVTEGLGKDYNGLAALKALSLAVPANSIFGFLGPNGAGKTTTIKLLLGLITPSRGRATVFGQDIVRDSLRIRLKVGYLPQEPKFYESMTARKVLNYTLHFYFNGAPSQFDHRVDEMLTLVDLTRKADRPISTFSGGERQRLGIAQAMINYPDLLILDEPTASLDPIGRHDVLELMAQLRQYATIFYSTHILGDVQRVSDTVAILNRGEAVAQGPINELLAAQEGIIYVIGLRGDVTRAHQRVSQQPWVTSVQQQLGKDETRWTVAVDDPKKAEHDLLRLILADDDVLVTQYQRKQYELEDIFLHLMEDPNHVSD